MGNAQEINKTMSIGEVLRLDRDTARIFMEFGMHCLGCPHATSESLEAACAVHGANADELVSKINAYLAELT
jgi:hybrid cluster-associated redox disulfide protein